MLVWRVPKTHVGSSPTSSATQIRRNNAEMVSRKLHDELGYRSFIAAWKSGMHNGSKSPNQTCMSNYLKRYIFEKYSSKCVECGWSKINPKTGKIPLHVDHIDGDWKNNTEINLRLLCPNCHSLTPNYGSLNNGKGRPRPLPKSNIAEASTEIGIGPVSKAGHGESRVDVQLVSPPPLK